jgi:hypothetical protein
MGISYDPGSRKWNINYEKTDYPILSTDNEETSGIYVSDSGDIVIYIISFIEWIPLRYISIYYIIQCFITKCWIYYCALQICKFTKTILEDPAF